MKSSDRSPLSVPRTNRSGLLPPRKGGEVGADEPLAVSISPPMSPAARLGSYSKLQSGDRKRQSACASPPSPTMTSLMPSPPRSTSPSPTWRARTRHRRSHSLAPVRQSHLSIGHDQISDPGCAHHRHLSARPSAPSPIASACAQQPATRSRARRSKSGSVVAANQPNSCRRPYSCREPEHAQS